MKCFYTLFMIYVLCYSMVSFCARVSSFEHEDALKDQKLCLKNTVTEHVKIYPLKNDRSQERIERSATFVHNKDAVATVLLCHGFLCSKEDIACFRNIFPMGKFNFLTFDFRGHGADGQDQVSTLGRDEAYDVIAAAHFIRDHQDDSIRSKPLIVWSFSMGAVASIEAQAKDTGLFDAMILDCPFDSSETLVKNSFDRMRFSVFGYDLDVPCRSLLQRYALHPYVQSFIQGLLKVVLNWDTKHVKLKIEPTCPMKSIQAISVPCFFIQCKNDTKVPLKSVKKLYKRAGGYKRLWITNGRRHFDSFFHNPELYTYRVRKFLDQVMRGSLYEKQREKIIEETSTVV